MRIVRVGVAAVLSTIIITGCAARNGDHTTQQASPLSAKDKVSSQPLEAAFGERRDIVRGLSVTITPPRSLTTSDTAYPAMTRAAVFQLTIDNHTALPYRPSQFLVKASISGKPTEEVVDSGQGLGGLNSANQIVSQGKCTTLTLAFAMPPTAAPLRITVQLNATDAGPTLVYQGVA